MRHNRTKRLGRRAQRGATLVEAALVLPLFFTVVLGIIEGSFLMRDYLTIANITGDAGRAASTYANDPDADFRIIQEIQGAAEAVGADHIIRVVVFKASGPDSAVPTACKTASSSQAANSCNIYPTAAFFDDDPTHFTCDLSQPFSSGGWCPTSRKVAIQGSGGPPDYLGVYVRLQHTSITRLFGGDSVLERTSIFRLEPQVLNG
jgi:Flp pilus assembly protein TadG